MVDQVLRSLTPQASRPSVRRRPAKASTPAALTLAMLVASLLAAAPACAADVTVETRTASGARGDVILNKSAPLGPAIDLKAAAPALAAGDPLSGLTLDPTREAVHDRAVASTSGMRLRGRLASDAAAKSPASDSATSSVSTATSTEAVSPVYVDAAGNARALPGGVIVTFDDDVSPETARATIEASGHTAERQLAPRIWLVATASGDAAVDAARALAARGDFRSVEPNWWRTPVPK